MINSTNSMDKRALIIKAAVRVFSRQGFHQARVEDIAQEAGVGKGTIYEYFENKRNLFEEVVLETFNFYSSQMEAAGFRQFHKEKAGTCPKESGLQTAEPRKHDSENGSTKPLKRYVDTGFCERIQHLFYMHLKFFIDYRDLSRVVLGDYALGSEMHYRMKSVRQEKINRLKEILEQGKKRGEVSQNLDTGLAAVLLWGMLGALWHQVAWEEEAQDILDIAEKATQIVLQGVRLKDY